MAAPDTPVQEAPKVEDAKVPEETPPPPPPAAAPAPAAAPESVETPPPAEAAAAEEVAAEAAAAPEGGEATAAGAPVAEATSLPSFKEESYFVKDLKESEKKALAEFSEKVEAAIQANEFVLPPVVEVVKETVVVQATEEVAVVAAVVETEIKEGDALLAKTEDVAVAVVTLAEGAPEALKEAVTAASEPPKEAEPAAEPPKEAEKAVEPPKEEEKAAAEPAEEVAEPPKEAETAAEAPKEEAPTPKVEEAKPEGEAPATEVAAETATEDAIVPEEKEAAPPEDLDLEIWGVPLLPSKGDPRTEVIFLKFLRARDFKVKDAFTMLKNTILWRKKYGADKILDEDLGTDFDGTSFNHGVDKEGHPVQYNVFGLLQDKALGDVALRWRVQLLEKTIKQLSFSPGGVTSILQVFDLKNAPLLSNKALRQFLLQAISVMVDNYPELVVKIVLLNTPWYYKSLYTFISPFLTQRTKSKFVFGTSLFKFISPDNIPVQYGGLSRANDAEFGDESVPVTELVLKSGEKQTVDIEVTAAGTTTVWDIAILGSDVTYGAEFVPSKEGGYTTVVQKPKKITIMEEPIRNTYTSSDPGKLVLSIDNSASRKKKTAVYRYLVKAPATEAAPAPVAAAAPVPAAPAAPAAAPATE